MNRRQRTEMVKTALGKAQADYVFTGGHLVNVYSGEILPELWVAFKGAHIVYTGPPFSPIIGEKTTVHDLEGRFLVPGFIDGHTHLDSIFKVKSYAEYALAYGNTTAVSEVSMIANAYGVKGVEYFLQETEDLPLRVFVLAPPLVPPFPELETSRAFPASFFRKLLADERCLGVGETYWPNIVGLEERALGQYQLSDEMGKTMEGHAAGARNTKLVAYAAAGTSSCHEATNLDEALDRLRLGMAVMIREGYVRREMEAIAGIAKKAVDLKNVMLVTDLADPEEPPAPLGQPRVIAAHPHEGAALQAVHGIKEHRDIELPAHVHLILGRGPGLYLRTGVDAVDDRQPGDEVLDEVLAEVLSLQPVGVNNPAVGAQPRMRGVIRGEPLVTGQAPLLLDVIVQGVLDRQPVVPCDVLLTGNDGVYQLHRQIAQQLIGVGEVLLDGLRQADAVVGVQPHQHVLPALVGGADHVRVLAIGVCIARGGELVAGEVTALEVPTVDTDLGEVEVSRVGDGKHNQKGSSKSDVCLHVSSPSRNMGICP